MTDSPTGTLRQEAVDAIRRFLEAENATDHGPLGWCLSSVVQLGIHAIGAHALGDHDDDMHSWTIQLGDDACLVEITPQYDEDDEFDEDEGRMMAAAEAIWLQIPGEPSLIGPFPSRPAADWHRYYVGPPHAQIVEASPSQVCSAQSPGDAYDAWLQRQFPREVAPPAAPQPRVPADGGRRPIEPGPAVDIGGVGQRYAAPTLPCRWPSCSTGLGRRAMCPPAPITI